MIQLQYIDPGTGSMLFAILIGIAGAVNYAARTALVKVRFLLSGGRNVEGNDSTIPYAIFSDDKRYWNVFEPLCREFDRRGVDVVYFTASEDDPAFNCNLDHVRTVFLGEGNKAFAKLNMLKADLLLSTTPGLDVYQWKRSKEVKSYVHILHAAGEVVLYRMFGLDYYDAVLVAGEFQRKDIRDLETLRELPAKDIAITGIPYMDEMSRRLEESGPAPEHPRTVLLAPSWGPSAIFSKFGDKVLEALVATGYDVVVRPHPQSFKSEAELIGGIMAKYPESEHLHWNRDTDNFECLKGADILISDFSGVVFDFSLVYDKPVIYTDTKFDTAPYDAWWLKRDVWTLSVLPRIGMQLTEEGLGSLKETVDACLEDPRFAAGRDEVRTECWQCKGQGTLATVDWLIAKHDQVVANMAKTDAEPDAPAPAPAPAPATPAPAGSAAAGEEK